MRVFYWIVIVLSILVTSAFSGCAHQKPVNLILFIGDGMGVTRVYEAMSVSGDDMTLQFFPVTGAFSITHHRGVMVAVSAFGPGSESFSGVHDNTQLFHYFYNVLATGRKDK